MKVNRWTVARRLVQLAVVLLLASPALGWRVFQGNLASAALCGFKLSDPLAALQIVLLTGALAIPAVVGTGVVLAAYGLLGGRVFCGWVCPVHLLTDLTDLLPGSRRGESPLRWKQWWLALALVLTIASGLPVFETISPIGIAGRGLGFGLAPELGLLVLIVLAELWLARRLWCRSLCPLGGLYALLGRLSPLAVAYRPERCTHCGRCRQVCFVPEVLDPLLESGCRRIQSGECSRCGACVGICPDKALGFGWRKPFQSQGG